MAKKFGEKEAFFRVLPFGMILNSQTPSVMHGWKAMDVRIHMVKGKKYLNWPAEFWQHFGSDFITPAETLSYAFTLYVFWVILDHPVVLDRNFNAVNLAHSEDF